MTIAGQFVFLECYRHQVDFIKVISYNNRRAKLSDCLTEKDGCTQKRPAAGPSFSTKNSEKCRRAVTSRATGNRQPEISIYLYVCVYVSRKKREKREKKKNKSFYDAVCVIARPAFNPFLQL